MNTEFAAHSSDDRRRRLRRLIWIAPLAILGGIGLFFGLGHLVVWLWRETLVDIFAVKPISFWQAWGLMLLSQILFKAHLRQSMGTGRRWRRARPGPDAADAGPDAPSGGREW